MKSILSQTINESFFEPQSELSKRLCNAVDSLFLCLQAGLYKQALIMADHALELSFDTFAQQHKLYIPHRSDMLTKAYIIGAYRRKLMFRELSIIHGLRNDIYHGDKIRETSDQIASIIVTVALKVIDKTFTLAQGRTLFEFLDPIVLKQYNVAYKALKDEPVAEMLTTLRCAVQWATHLEPHYWILDDDIIEDDVDEEGVDVFDQHPDLRDKLFDNMCESAQRVDRWKEIKHTPCRICGEKAIVRKNKQGAMDAFRCWRCGLLISLCDKSGPILLKHFLRDKPPTCITVA